MSRSAESPLRLIVSPDEAGERLDRLLARHLPHFSRSRLQALIADGHVQVNARTTTRPSLKVRGGEEIVLAPPTPRPSALRPEAIPLDIRHEDEHLLVIDKPAGLVVHPAPGHETGTLVHALLHHCGDSLSGIGGERRLGIVHRLDRETSGLMVIAKTDATHRALSHQFAAHGRDGHLRRAYLALVWGVPRLPRGTIDAPVGRATRDRRKMTVRPADDPRARWAITHHETLETFVTPTGRAIAALLRCRLETGRTHQIRVHMAHIGHPVMGDPVYGRSHATSSRLLPSPPREALDALGRQALHAAELGFVHPASGQPMLFESAPPRDMRRLLDALRAMREDKAPLS